MEIIKNQRKSYVAPADVSSFVGYFETSFGICLS